MTEERFRKYLAFKALDQVGGADTRDLADDLAREWDGAAYVRVDVADSANAALQRRNDTQAESIMEFQAEEKSLRSRLAQVEKERDEMRTQLRAAIPYVNGKRRQLRLLRHVGPYVEEQP